jgi:formylglycine-generating enzyme required for sulfatase activity
MVWIAGGTFWMGSDEFHPEEGPVHRATVDGFWMDRHPVTTQQFALFVRTTGYVTVAERPPSPREYPAAPPELLVPGSAVFHKTQGPVDLANPSSWWAYVPGTDWRHPEGPWSSIAGRSRHPVVHVAYEDAEAYALWAGKELPTEEEWEYAARGELSHAIYPWGDEFAPGGKLMANTWQGEFPWQNLCLDGYEGTSPVGAFPPNSFGLYDMVGNVWEWTSSWYRPRHTERPAPPGRLAPGSPGDLPGGRFSRSDPHRLTARKVIKGGSFLCSPNNGMRYRSAARLPEAVDSSTSDIGFRCISRVSG